MNLDELAIKYKTDKSSLCHNYAEKYDLFFNISLLITQVQTFINMIKKVRRNVKY